MPLESLHIPDFSSPLTKNRNRHGGGVALYVLSSLAAIRRVDLECNEFEIMWVELKLGKLKVFVVFVIDHQVEISHILKDF